MSQSEGLQTVTSGTTVTISNGVKFVFIDPTSLMASLAITLSPNPSDRDTVYFFFGGTLASGVSVVTVLSFLGNGAAILGTLLSTASSGSCIILQYRQSNNSWYKISSL